MNKVQFVLELAKLRPSSTFLTLSGYRNEFSEIADYSILFHMDYKSALEKSVRVMERFSPTTQLETQAKQELLAGFYRSIVKAKETSVEEIDDAYTRFFDQDGNYVKGIKEHTATGILHLYGIVVHKRVVMPGIYPNSGGSELAQVKRRLRKTTPVGRYRQFKMVPDQVDHISVENISLMPPL